MSVCCLNCGKYFGEFEEPYLNDFCNEKCAKAFLENIEKEVAEFEDEE